MEALKKILDVLFVTGIITFMILGSVIVAVQFFGVVTLDGALAISINKTLSKTTFVIASITGLIGFVQVYVNRWEMGD